MVTFSFHHTKRPYTIKSSLYLREEQKTNTCPQFWFHPKAKITLGVFDTTETIFFNLFMFD